MIMKKFTITCATCFLICISPIIAIFSHHNDILEDERRSISKFPVITGKLDHHEIKKFFSDFDKWFADRVPLRRQFVSLSSELYDMFGSIFKTNKCYRGKENWLFLGNDYDRCVDTLTGVIKSDPKIVERQVRFYKAIDTFAKQNGIKFAILIGPNKSTIYPEYLPPTIIPAQERYILPLLSSLKEQGISIYDPTDRLLEEKKKGLLYWRTDTHWNPLGAYEAFVGFKPFAGISNLPELALSPAQSYRGDLVDIGGFKKFPLSEGDNFTPQWGKEKVPVSEKSALVLGDSFSGAQIFYLNGYFKEVRVEHYKKIITTYKDMTGIKKLIDSMKIKPEVILWIQVERSFAHYGQN